jgi:integrase
MTFYLPNAVVESWKPKYKRNTLAAFRHALKKLLRWLESIGAQRDLSTNLKRVPTYQPRQTLVSHEELEKLFFHAKPWMRFLLVACHTLAVRSGEARRLAPYHYDKDRKEIRSLKAKNNRLLTMPVVGELEALILAINAPADCQTPYVEILSGRTIDNSYLCDCWLALKKKSGVRHELRIHDIRRTTATEFYEATQDIVAVQRLLGHQSLTATVAYIAHADQETLRPVLEKLRAPWTKIPMQTEVKQ